MLKVQMQESDNLFLNPAPNPYICVNLNRLLVFYASVSFST